MISLTLKQIKIRICDLRSRRIAVDNCANGGGVVIEAWPGSVATQAPAIRRGGFQLSV